MWGVFTDWSDLEPLLRSPQAWVADYTGKDGEKLPQLAEGVITIVVNYQIEHKAKLPQLAGYSEKDDETEKEVARPVFILGGAGAGVVQVRILQMPQSGVFPPDLALWMPPSGATLHLPGSSQPIPGGSVIEFQDGSTITVPGGNVDLTVTLQRPAGIGYLHFPLFAFDGPRFFSLAVQDPQGYIQAVRSHMNTRPPIVKVDHGDDNPELDSDPPKVLLENLIGSDEQQNIQNLRSVRMIYQYSPTDSYNICGKIIGTLSLEAPTEQSYNFRIDTFVFYDY
jgi:hypothetical protein